MRFNVTNNRGVLSLVPLVDCNPFHISNLYAFFNKTAMEFFKNSRAMRVPVVRVQICIIRQSLVTDDVFSHSLKNWLNRCLI